MPRKNFVSYGDAEALFTEFVGGLKMRPFSITLTAGSPAWTKTGNVYTQTISVPGLGASDRVLVSMGDVGEANRKDAARCMITKTAQEANALTFEALSLPNINIPVNVIAQGGSAS